MIGDEDELCLKALDCSQTVLLLLRYMIILLVFKVYHNRLLF